MTPCERCHGAGSYEHHTHGFEGVPERDDEVVCSDCGGLGSCEAFDMLACLILVRDAHRLAVRLGGVGIGGAQYARLARTIASVADYSTERFAELRAREMMREAVTQ